MSNKHFIYALVQIKYNDDVYVTINNIQPIYIYSDVEESEENIFFESFDDFNDWLENEKAQRLICERVYTEQYSTSRILHIRPLHGKEIVINDVEFKYVSISIQYIPCDDMPFSTIDELKQFAYYHLKDFKEFMEDHNLSDGESINSYFRMMKEKEEAREWDSILSKMNEEDK